MSLPLRVCLFGPADVDRDAFSAAFQNVDGLRVIATCPTWQHLQGFLDCGHLDAVIVNLDRSVGQATLTLVQRILEVAPDCGIIGVSRSAEPDAIIAAMRAGCSQFVRWPIDPADLRSALGRLRRRHTRGPIASQRLCVLGSSGGTGATTVACNLAIELAHVTARGCALVDMNLQFGDVACSFDVTPRYSVADVCRNNDQIDRTLLESALEELACGVSILGRPEQVLACEELTPEGIEQTLVVLGQMFPFVVVDLPRQFSPGTVATLEGADRVLIVTQLAVPQLRNATRIFEHLVELGANEQHIHVVLNRCNANFERIKPDEVEKQFRRPVFATIPNDYKRMGASRDLGHPIMTDAPNSPVRLAIQEMARRIAAAHLGQENLPQTGSGVLGMFRKKKRKVKQAT